MRTVAAPVSGGDRLAVLTRARGDAPGVVVVDPSTGPVDVGPGTGRVRDRRERARAGVASAACDCPGTDGSPQSPRTATTGGSGSAGSGLRGKRPTTRRPVRARARRRREAWSFAWLGAPSRAGAVLAVDPRGAPPAGAPRSPSTRPGLAGVRSPEIELPAGASRPRRLASVIGDARCQAVTGSRCRRSRPGPLRAASPRRSSGGRGCGRTIQALEVVAGAMRGRGVEVT